MAMRSTMTRIYFAGTANIDVARVPYVEIKNRLEFTVICEIERKTEDVNFTDLRDTLLTAIIPYR